MQINVKRGYVIAAGLVTAMLLTASSCDKFSEPFKDAPRGETDGGAAEVVEMPDGFSNLATKCLTVHGERNGIRVTVAYHGDNKYAAVSTVVDPSCNP